MATFAEGIAAGLTSLGASVKALTARVTDTEGVANAALPATALTGVTKIVVVAVMPMAPDANTLYITTE